MAMFWYLRVLPVKVMASANLNVHLSKQDFSIVVVNSPTFFMHFLVQITSASIIGCSLPAITPVDNVADIILYMTKLERRWLSLLMYEANHKNQISVLLLACLIDCIDYNLIFIKGP
jgi:hypothetical protein